MIFLYRTHVKIKLTPNTRTLKGQSYCSQRWANPAWPKGSKSRGFSTRVVFRSNNDFSVCKNFGLTYFFEALSKNKTESFETNATYSMDFGAYLSLMKGKMNIRLLYENAFYKRRITTTRGDGWTKRRINLSPDSHVLLTIGWNFNAGRQIKKQDLPTVNKQDREIPTF